ncbi:hypothetical protein EB796_013004 [Bugula neritina]|uniref:Uncharacterized protein n=1 Tax=Bugula neritina TaxID=10212 RepID=A0A7J7JRZ9_BUGNE|nr:hypothetical protein EB796_013004 [Bugula neritina]
MPDEINLKLPAETVEDPTLSVPVDISNNSTMQAPAGDVVNDPDWQVLQRTCQIIPMFHHLPSYCQRMTTTQHLLSTWPAMVFLTEQLKTFLFNSPCKNLLKI